MLLNTLRPSRDDSVFFAKDIRAFLPCRVGDELFHSLTRKMRRAPENQQQQRKKGRKSGKELHAARNQQQPGRNCRKELRAGCLLLFHWARKKGSFIIYPCLGFPMRLETTGLAGLAAPVPVPLQVKLLAGAPERGGSGKAGLRTLPLARSGRITCRLGKTSVQAC